jgi:hypothetical protein
MSDTQTEQMANVELPHGDDGKPGKKWDTPVRAIRRYCLVCCCDSRKEVRDCILTHCALYPFRMGRRPTSTTDH